MLSSPDALSTSGQILLCLLFLFTSTTITDMLQDKKQVFIVINNKSISDTYTR